MDGDEDHMEEANYAMGQNFQEDYKNRQNFRPTNQQWGRNDQGNPTSIIKEGMIICLILT